MKWCKKYATEKSRFATRHLLSTCATCYIICHQQICICHQYFNLGHPWIIPKFHFIEAQLLIWLKKIMMIFRNYLFPDILTILPMIQSVNFTAIITSSMYRPILHHFTRRATTKRLPQKSRSVKMTKESRVLWTIQLTMGTFLSHQKKIGMLFLITGYGDGKKVGSAMGNFRRKKMGYSFRPHSVLFGWRAPTTAFLPPSEEKK